MKKLLSIVFLLSAVLWSQEESSILTSKKTFTATEGYLISSPYHASYGANGWLWILGENKLSNEYISGEQEIIIQRFDGANFFSLRLPNSINKKIKNGCFFKHGNNGLYLKLYYEAAKAELFYINTETLEIKPVEEYNVLNKHYSISEAFTIENSTYIVLASNDKFYSGELDKFEFKFIDSISFEKPVTDPFILDPVVTDGFTLIRLISEKEGHFLSKEGKFIEKITESNFEADDGSNFYPDVIHTSIKVNDTFYVYLDSYKNAFKFIKANKKFIETENTAFLQNESKVEEFTSDFQHVLSTEIFSDYTNIELNRFKNFEKELITKVEVENFSKIVYKQFGNDLVVLNGNTLESYSFIESKIKTFLKGKSIRAIRKLKENKYIVATDTEGFYKIDVIDNTEELIKILTDTIEQNINYSRHIFNGKDNNFIIGDSDHLYTLDSNFRVIQNKTTGIDGENIVKIEDTLFIVDQIGSIYKYSINENRYDEVTHTNALKVQEIATDGTRFYAISSRGIFEYENGIFNTYEFEKVDTDHLLSINYLEGYGVLVSTKFGQIYAFDTKTKKINIIYEDDLNASIVGFVADDTGVLWLNTFAGIVSVNPASKETTRYTTKDGVYELQGNRFSTYKDEQEGSILMGSHKGLSYFKPDEMVKTNLDVQPQFTSISYFNSEKERWEINTSPEFLNSNKEIVLPSEYRRFSATLSVFGKTNPQDIKYRFRLLDSENNLEWYTTYPGRELLYANLAAGRYTLEVEAFSPSQPKIGERISLKIISEEAFYKTWWFILLLLLFAFISILYLFYQYKVKQDLHAKSEIALNEANIKNTMMLEIHHRIKNNLQIVSGLLGLQMAKSTNEELKVKLQDSQTRIESIAGLHNLLYNTNNQDFIFVKENIENSVSYYQKLFPKRVKYHLDIDASLLSIKQATPFSLLLNELINNSNKHAFEKIDYPEIFIHFEKHCKTYVFEYFDNGSFKNQQSQNESMGMKIIEMMSKQLRGNIKIENISNFKLTLHFTTDE